jgi:hypothetical protein
MAKLTRTQFADKSYKPQGRVIRRDGMYIGFVKDVTDVQKMGRLLVWIPEFGSRAEDEKGWITVSYSSPFAGATNPNLLGNNAQTAEGTQTSYGMWMVPPDLENQVLVMFANGDPTRGVAMGFLYQQFMNNMVPGIPAGQNHQFDVDAPMAEYNKRTQETVKEDIVRPALTNLSQGINAQGLIRDKVRGVSNSSARREAPSEVYGFLTPGPNNPDVEGKRLGGSQFYMDDNTDNEHIRVRTKSGAQMLIDETNGIVYAINRTGTSWMQMDAEGNFDIFGASSVSVRSLEDINLRADNNVNIEAGKNVTIKAAKDGLPREIDPIPTPAVGQPGEGEGGDIIIEAYNDFTTTTVEGSMFTSSLQGDYSLTVAGNRLTTIDGNEDLNVTGYIKTTSAGAVDVKSGGNMTVSSGGTLGIGSSNFNVSTGGDVGGNGKFVAGGDVISGGDVKTGSIALNGLHNHTHVIASGSSAGKTKPYTGSGGGGSVSGPSAQDAGTATPVTPLSPASKTNVLSSFSGSANDTRETEDVLSVVGRFLTYEPCPEHNNKGE